MQLTPRYGDDAVLRLGARIDDPVGPMVRQRKRFVAILAGLDDEQWATPSRCAGWSVQDVVAHLITTNQFWTISILSGLKGEPTQYLATFDPVATPAQMVDAVRATPPAETLRQFDESCAALAAAVDDLDDAAWSTPAEAPPGHVAIPLVVLHALWDSWIHERDVVVPLGLPATDAPDEISACLRYAAALGPTFSASLGATRVGSLEVHATDPDVRFVVDAGASVVLHDRTDSPTATITGDAVALIEGLSFRAPLVVDLADEDRWLLGDLGPVFDVPR